MVKSLNKIFRGKKTKANFSRPEGAGNFDNMDDYNIVQSTSLRQGTIQHTPTNAKDIVNKEYVDDVVGQAFPVGAVFLSVVSTNPNTLLGYGTWSSIGAGRVLVGLDSGDADFNTVEETGGSKTHTITEAELPAHTHAAGTLANTNENSHTHAGTTDSDGAHTHDITTYEPGDSTDTVQKGDPSTSVGAATVDSAGAHTHSFTTGAGSAHTHTISGSTGSVGSGNAVSIVQPYIVVYMWKRTA